MLILTNKHFFMSQYKIHQKIYFKYYDFYTTKEGVLKSRHEIKLGTIKYVSNLQQSMIDGILRSVFFYQVETEINEIRWIDDNSIIKDILNIPVYNYEDLFYTDYE